ncbi:MAG: 6,7-dimethyl-8-ribityllumazine synthase [Betaproteobacteria bacterium]|nr:6,7-dimethyl-8-ribityllumazine synthase [Betaproteobacteria bacterium]
MQDARLRDDPALLDARGLRIALVQARFNIDITDGLAQSCVRQLRELGAEPVRLVTVPGALEVPQALDMLARAGGVDALVALGCVIRGETYHFELVCDTSAVGIQEVALRHGIGIANGVITVENEAQALARVDKGAECARVAVEMANLARSLRRAPEAATARAAAEDK